jgi:Tol biopolymer transport system component
MNEQQAFERLVADSVSGIGPLAPSAGAIERTMSRVSSRRQRPRWLALIEQPPMRRSSRLVVGSPTARVATIMVATILLALVLAVAAVAGSRLLADDDASDAMGNGPIIVNGTAYDPYTGEMGPDPCNCTSDASWSADGQRVAFRRSSRIYVTDLAERNERLVAHCADCDDPSQDAVAMAADGGSVAFVDEGDIWLVDVDTGTRTRITELGEGRRAQQPTLDPAGDRVAFVIDGEPGIWVTDLAGGEPWPLTMDTGPIDPDFRFGPYSPAWSPDGRTIAYLQEPGLDLQLWLVDVATGEQRRIRDWPGCCMTGWGGPAWSPDGRELAVVATGEHRPGRASSWQLWVVAADGSAIRSVGGPGLGQPAWRPVPVAEAATSLAEVAPEGSPMPT